MTKSDSTAGTASVTCQWGHFKFVLHYDRRSTIDSTIHAVTHSTIIRYHFSTCGDSLSLYSCSFTLVQLHTSWDICMCDVFMVMLTHLFLTALLSFLCWWFVPLWWFLGAFARPESVNILIQNNLNKLDEAMRFGYAVRQAEIRHQALLSWFGNHGNGPRWATEWKRPSTCTSPSIQFCSERKMHFAATWYFHIFSYNSPHSLCLRFCGHFMNLLET